MSEQFDFSKLAEIGDVPDPLEASPSDSRLRELRLASDAPDRKATQRRRWVAFAISCAWLLVHLLVFGVRGDLNRLPLSYVLEQIALPFVLAIASLALALQSGKLGLGARVGALASLAVVGPAAFGILAATAPAPRPELAGEGSGVRILLCLDLTLLWTVLPLACAALCLRHAFPTASRWRSALVGAAAGLLASGIMNLHCPNVNRLHIALGHGFPIVIAVIVSAVLMPRATRT